MSPGLLQCLIQHIKEGVLGVGTIRGCVYLVETAVLTLLDFLFSTICVPLGVPLQRGADIFECYTVNEGAIRVPTFYACPKQDGSDLMVRGTLTSIVAMLFGGIHCAGWNFPFPSHAELIIWRVCSLIILIVPCTAALVVAELAMGITNMMSIITVLVFLFGTVFYVLARLTLFVEALIALRHPSPGAYAVVEWTALLLHM